MNGINIVEYKEELRRDWDNFVKNSNNGTMFHLQSFLDYHYPGKFNFRHLMFYKNNELIAVLPGGINPNSNAYWSPTGASYGSFVTKDIPFNSALDVVDTFLEYCKTEKFRDVYLIPPPLIYSKVYNQHTDYAMLYRKADFELHYISHAVPLKNENVYSKIDKKAQKIIEKIKRENKIQIRESEDYEAFFPILLENKAKHNTKPTHSLEDLLKLKQLVPDNLKLFMVYENDVPIAGNLLFLTNEKVALCFYIMILYNYKHLKPTFLAMSEAILWAAENGYEWYDIGVSQDTSAEDPMTPSLNLIYFKERFNARGILRSTYHFGF
jgi:hypothetical protein